MKKALHGQIYLEGTGLTPSYIGVFTAGLFRAFNNTPLGADTLWEGEKTQHQHTYSAEDYQSTPYGTQLGRHHFPFPWGFVARAQESEIGKVS